MAEHYILNEAGEAVATDLMTWAHWFETANRHVALTELSSTRVSTVFLGLDHSFGSGPPLIFETMVFGGNHADYSERYTTKAEALAGHERIVRMIQDTTL